MKKVLSLLVVMCMIVSTLPAVSAHWADEDVKYLIENGAIAEDDAMLETLDTPITRSQMVKVIVALLDGDEPIVGKEYFTDITLDDTHIAKAAENGFVNGFGDGTFRPNNPITRQDFFTIVGRAYKLEGEATKEFTDNDAIADYAKPYVDALQSIGIVNGYGDGTVNPRGNITIAETLAVMRRTDEHVKANTPEEQPEEEDKKPTGSSGGGGGGFNSSTQPSWSRKEADELMPTATFTVEYTNDWSSGTVAYVTADINSGYNNITRKMLLKDTIYRTTMMNSIYYTREIAEQTGQYISEENGKFAIPDFGKYALYVCYGSDSWVPYKFEVKAPLSNDNTPPELALELEGEQKFPMTFKVIASDDVGIARINYAELSGIACGDDNEACGVYKIHVKDRKIITDNSFTMTKSGGFVICAMDVNGNLTSLTISVDGQGYGYISDSESCIANNTVPSIENSNLNSPFATFTVEREDEFSSEYVAHVKADIALPNGGTIKKKLLLKDGDYIGDVDGPNNGSWEVAEKFGQYIAEEDGVFHIPDFDKYALYVQNDAGTWYKATFEVKPPESDDTTPPVLTIKAPQEAYLPTTVQVEAEDDAGIARISYVMPSVIRILRGRKTYDRFNVYVNGREILTGNDLTLDEGYRYAICAMDVNGNCSYAFVSVGGSSNENPDANLIQVEYGDEDTRPDRTAPMIYFDRYDSNLTLKAYFEDNKEVTEAGWFYMSEPYEMDSDEKQIKRAYILDGQTIDLSKNIEGLTEFDGEHGGLGSVCILKNYYDATQEINGVKITPISGKPWVPIIDVHQNGAYFIYAKDSAGNLSVVRIDIDNINSVPEPDSTEP